METYDKSAQEFLNVVLELQNSIPSHVREKVLLLTKTADANVKSLFFPDAPDTGLDKKCVLLCRELSVRYVSLILSLNQKRPDLAAKITTSSYNDIANWFKMAGTQIGESIYRECLIGKLTIPEHNKEREEYFSCIIQSLTTTAYIEVTKAISAAKTPAPAQLIISALKVLDCRSYNSVILSWSRTEFFQQTFANTDLFQLLLSYPWLQEYSANVLSEDLSPDVSKQVQENPNGVLKWIESPEGPRAYGLLNL